MPKVECSSLRCSLCLTPDHSRNNYAFEPSTLSSPIKRSFFFHAEYGIRDDLVTGVQTCALPISDRTPAGASTVTVLIRPERIRLAAAPPHGAADVNRLAVRVADVTYLGEDLQVLLDLDGGPTLDRKSVV